MVTKNKKIMKKKKRVMSKRGGALKKKVVSRKKIASKRKVVPRKRQVGNNSGFNKSVLIIGVLCFILFISLIFVLILNYNLRKDIRELNENINTFSSNAVKDFSLFVMSKVDKCEPVTLMAQDKSITINNVLC